MSLKTFLNTSFVLVSLVLLSWTITSRAEAGSRSFSSVQANLEQNYGRIPLSFEPNQGQEDGRVRYLSRGSGYSLFLTQDEAVFLFKRYERKRPTYKGEKLTIHPGALPPDIVRIQMEGANRNASFEGEHALEGISNYFFGSDPSKWLTGIRQYSRVRARDLYPGVDMVYYGNQRQLEYDFEVQPGADMNVIRLKITGADKVNVDNKGNLVLTVKDRLIRFLSPSVYQEGLLSKEVLKGTYRLVSDNEVAFEVDSYDKAKKLVIDPVLDYGTNVGGTGSDIGWGIAVDSNGNAYVTGATSGNFPTTGGTVSSSFPSKSSSGYTSVFVFKLNSTGSGLLYSTYLGGTNTDAGRGIAVDGNGDAYVTGQAGPGFPTTSGAFQTAFGGDYYGYSSPYYGDVFLTKLNPTGTGLLYSTYLGGSGIERGDGIAIDASGAAYISGWTTSSNFPTTSGAAWTSFDSSDLNGFVSKIAPNGSGSSDLVYSTLLGETRSNVVPPYDPTSNLTVDSSGNVYVVGDTNGTDFPLTAGAYNTTYVPGGNGDIFALKLNSSGTAFVYSTYIGIGGGYGGYQIVLGPNLNAYFSATVNNTTGYPTTSGAYDTTESGLDGVVTGINATGTSLVYSTFTGQAGSAAIYPVGLQLDNCGNIHFVGYTSNSSYPTTSGAWSNSYGGAFNGFYSVLNPTLSGSSQLVYSTFVGGGNNYLYLMAKDPSGNLYVVGQTDGSLPTTSGAYQTSYGGSGDAYVMKIDISSICSNPATSTPTILATGTSTSTITVSSTATNTQTVTYTQTASSTPTATASETNTNTPTASATATSTNTVTSTPTETNTASATNTPTVTSTVTSTPTDTSTPTLTNTETVTSSQTQTSTPTVTFTQTSTNTSTVSSTETATYTVTSTETWTGTETNTNTPTVTATASPTRTSTSTSTVTYTATSTSTPTVTSTSPPTNTQTMTATPGEGYSICPPYPNPIRDNYTPVSFCYTLYGPATVRWDVFTTAFRKICGNEFYTSSNGTVTWNLKDKAGKDIANGIYYLRVEIIVPGFNPVRKISKILVVR